MYTHDYYDICLFTNLSIGWMPLCHDSQHSCIGSPGDAVRGASCFQFNFSSAIGIHMFNDLYIYVYIYNGMFSTHGSLFFSNETALTGEPLRLRLSQTETPKLACMCWLRDVGNKF